MGGKSLSPNQISKVFGRTFLAPDQRLVRFTTSMSKPMLRSQLAMPSAFGMSSSFIARISLTFPSHFASAIEGTVMAAPSLSLRPVSNFEKQARCCSFSTVTKTRDGNRSTASLNTAWTLVLVCAAAVSARSMAPSSCGSEELLA